MAAFLFQNLDCKYGTWRLFLVTRSAMLAPRRVSLTTREYPTSRHVVLPHTGAAALNHTLPGGAPLQYENYTEYFSLSLVSREVDYCAFGLRRLLYCCWTLFA